MANEEQVARLRRSVSEWNLWRKRHPEEVIDLSSVDLHDAVLSEANLRGATLIQANLVKANLYQAVLSDANMRFADLRGTTLRRANLRAATLSKADLREADLVEATLYEADLSEANLSFANLSGAILRFATLRDTNVEHVRFYQTLFADLDLQSAQGLVEIEHLGSSPIELYSVQLPRDGSALHFLRSVGVPDNWIDFYRASMMHPIQYYSCFISYSHQDEALATRLHSDLQAKGIRCWFAPHNMKIGDKLLSTIDQAIHMHEKVLLLLSKHALASDWVEREVQRALTKEREQKRPVLFPVRLDESILHAQDAWAFDVRLHHIGDFTNWEQHQVRLGSL